MEEKQKSASTAEIGKPALEHGVQPLDQLMTEHELSNTDVVKASAKSVTHKMVNKGRRGRRLSRKVQTKVYQAFCSALRGRDDCLSLRYELSDTFNYDGR
jgi:hypothetical protein